MPIEFRCTQCNKLLRTGDDTAGRPAQCPACGAIGIVPGAVDAAEAITPELVCDNPFGDLHGEPSPSAADNPYRSPNCSSSQLQDEAAAMWAKQRVAGPAIALIVTACLGIVTQLGSIAIIGGNADGMAMRGIWGDADGTAMYGRNQAFGKLQMPTAVSIVQSVIAVGLGVLVLFGAIRMKKLESYGLAMTAAIVAMIPCISPCCFLGLPFGIWALVVLSDSSVRAAFRH